ncbi:spore coat protein [Niameybacter massiliensis]|uniref:Spore coat protein n=1 Tax=Holtiella tumoricola TaxID=3018743 RepID=A0AA42DQC4_9FIRM|nr:spore coat protein [Holtiella tumoricola]MDA3732876.1 spore coat protein [Holtiella tumoricola]
MSNIPVFTEKEILADALEAQKSATALYNLIANECAKKELKDTMVNLLNDEHNLQYGVFTSMHNRGFYPTPPAEQQKVDQAKQTFAPQAHCQC